MSTLSNLFYIPTDCPTREKLGWCNDMAASTEQMIQNAITALTKDKTTIMIAHRLSTLRDADELIVIEHGKVAERGTHRELLAIEGGVYNKLYTLQAEALKNAGITE